MQRWRGWRIVLVVGLLLAACASEEKAPPAPTSDPNSIAGMITNLEVEGNQLIRITIVDEAGKTHILPIDMVTPVSVSVTHLRVHQMEKLPVELVLMRRESQLVVTRIDDYTPAPPKK
jgi:hypothetical protein